MDVIFRRPKTRIFALYFTLNAHNIQGSEVDNTFHETVQTITFDPVTMNLP